MGPGSRRGGTVRDVEPRPSHDSRAWALPAAVAVLALENTALLAALLFVGSAPPAISAFLLIKFPFCVGLLHRRHGAFLFLTFWEACVIVIALLNPTLALGARLGLLASATTGLGLLGLSLALFPETRLPPAGTVDPSRN